MSRGYDRGVLTPRPSGMSRVGPTTSSNSSALNLVKPHFLEVWISGGRDTCTWPCIEPRPPAPGSAAGADGCGDVPTWSWPLGPGTFQRHLRPFPVWSVSALAQDHVLLVRLMWKGRAALGCENPSLPQLVTMYLLAQTRAVSSASEESSSCSSDTTWPQRGPRPLCLPPPQVKDEDLASETPRQKRDRSGLLLQYR